MLSSNHGLGAPAPPRIQLCDSSSAAGDFTKWTVPAAGAPAAPITVSIAGNGSNCLITASQVGPGNTKCDPTGKGCATIGACAGAPLFSVKGADIVTASGTVCIDFEQGVAVQLYPCVQSSNQGWHFDAESGKIVSTDTAFNGAYIGLSSDGNCKPFGPPAPAPPAPPAPRNPYCVNYHPIHDGNVYDPSGPLLDATGLWHTWEDDGAWSHWTSKDLIHWSGSFRDNTTHFGGDTGSVSPTPSGVYAFWPIMGGPDRGWIGSAKATDATLTNWDQRGKTVPQPKRINAGYRDPVRAFKFGEKWFQGVGCGSKEVGAQFCIFEAKDDTLMEFTDQGSLYTTNVTYGNVDGNIVWQPQNVSANMMECPDLFPLGDKWVLIGSLYKTNQWWVGDMVADAGGVPRFTPDQVGILDYGNGYAAKTGSTMEQSGTTRRVVFGFTGWSEPTTAPGCGRSLIMPRDLSVSGTRLVINPVPETAVLRVAGTHTSGATTPLAKGSQVEIRVTCPFTTAPSTGKTHVRVLSGADGSYTEIGYDFSVQAFYADHSKCCDAANTIVQRAPLSTKLMAGGLNMTVFVDGGTIESFANGMVITPLVSPSVKIAPEDRASAFDAGPLASSGCTVDSWQQKY